MDWECGLEANRFLFPRWFVPRSDLAAHKWVLLVEAKPEEEPTLGLWTLVGAELTEPDQNYSIQVKLPWKHTVQALGP